MAQDIGTKSGEIRHWSEFSPATGVVWLCELTQCASEWHQSVGRRSQRWSEMVGGVQMRQMRHTMTHPLASTSSSVCFPTARTLSSLDQSITGSNPGSDIVAWVNRTQRKICWQSSSGTSWLVTHHKGGCDCVHILQVLVHVNGQSTRWNYFGEVDPSSGSWTFIWTFMVSS